MTFDASTQPEAISTATAPESAPAVQPVPPPNPIKDAAPQMAPEAVPAVPAVAADAAKAPTPPAASVVPAGHMMPATPAPSTLATVLNLIKREELLVQVAGKIRDFTAVGKTEADAVRQLIAEYDALVIALNPHGEAMKAASAALAKELNAQIADEHCHIPVAEAVKTMHGIFTKRQAEAQSSRALLSDKAFMDQAMSMAASGATLKATHWFTDAKKEEIVTELLADSPAHTLGNGIGQHFLHKALANVYRLDGPLQPALSKALQAAAPAMSADAVIATARHWLHARFHRADTLATEMKPGIGALYIEAMKRADAKVHVAAQHAPMNRQEAELASQVEAELARISALPASQPEAVTHAPAQHAGTVAQAPAIAQEAPAL